MPAEIRENWTLVIAGGLRSDHDDQRYYEGLVHSARGLNIEFRPNVDAVDLAVLYSISKIFWHATGFQRAEDRPEEAEHFGMTTVEAMSYGCVPIVYADGGQEEIVRTSFGVLWVGTSELVARTVELVCEPERLASMAKIGWQESAKYDLDVFSRNVHAVLF